MANNAYVITFDTVSDMTGYASPQPNEKASLLGYYAPGDGGGGDFYWNSGSSATVDSGVVFSSTGGRWIRLYDGTLNPRYYGAKGDGTTDDSTAFNNCLANVYASIFTCPMARTLYKILMLLTRR